jgi:hypothetical protein
VLEELILALFDGRAVVLIAGAWRSHLAWDYLEARGYKRFDVRECRRDPTPRTADLDGEIHTEGECCKSWSPCPRCGARQHTQGIYGGLMTLCERCPADADYWRAPDAGIDSPPDVVGSGS